uniref:Pectinesterase inhibitor domain-containing protein n=1 Tax=Nelumbo nucifera TaxID=4432 RepID=A0A822Z8G4_NELNU|nr:TPA_asm: hypothetical protein HUJ06_013669 [Nelumbo nucifera]
MNLLFSIFSLSFCLFFSSHSNVLVSNIISQTCRACAKRSPYLSYNFYVTCLQAVPERVAVRIFKDLMTIWNYTLIQILHYETRIRYFKYEDYNSANVYISEAMESASTCNSGFEEGVVNPLMKERDNFIQLCEIALVISNFPLVFSFSSRVISILSHLFIDK